MEHSFRIGSLGISWGFLLAYLWVASYFGADFSQSMWSVPERGIGLVFMSLAWFAFSILSQPLSSFFLRRALAVSFVLSALLSLFVVYDVATSPGRPDMLFGNAAFLASYLLLHAFIGLYLARLAPSPLRFACVLASFVLMAATALTETRGAVLGLAFGLIVLAAHDASVSRRRTSAIFAVTLLLALSAFFFTRDMAVWHGIPVLGKFAGTASEISGGRSVAWQAAGGAVRLRPLAGWGFENFDYAFNANYRASFSGIPGAEDFFSKPHNIFLEYAVSGGIPGLLLFLVFLFLVFRSLSAGGIPVRHRTPLFGFLAAYAVSQFFLFDSYASVIPLILVLAHIASQAPMRAVSSRVAITLSMIALVLIFLYSWQSIVVMRSNASVSRAVSAMAEGNPAAAFSAWENAYDAGGPYRHSVARRYAAALQDALSHGVDIPNASIHAAYAMDGLEAAISAHPQSYFYRMAYADAAPAFSRYDASYLPQGAMHAAYAISLSPHRAEARYVLAKIYLKQGDGARAVAAMKEAVLLDPESPDAHFFHGLVLFSTERTEDGLASISRAAGLGRLSRTAPEAKILGDWYGDAGDYGGALHEYDRALSHSPDNPDILFNRALVLYYMGNRSAARDAFSSISARFPGFRQNARYLAASPIFRLLGLPIAP